MLLIIAALAFSFAIYQLISFFITIDRELKTSREWLIAFKKSQQETENQFNQTINLKVRSAGVMLIVKDGLILGVSRRDNHSIFGLLGGKNEDEEDLEETAKREALEEAGIVVSSCILFHQRLEPGVKDGIDYYCKYYYATEWEPYWDEVCCPEGMKLQWLTEKEITKTKAAFPDTIKDVFKAFHQKFPDVELK